MVMLRVRLLSLGLVCFSLLGSIYGQERPGRQFIRGLLETFIESQLPNNAVESGNAPAGITSSIPEMREASQVLQQASDEMAGLVSALQGDLYRARGVRQLLSLAMNVNADAAVLSRRLARATSVESLREPLRKLDQDWHTLEYRLSNTSNLSRTTLGHIERIRQYESKLASMFDVATQVDMAAIDQQASEMLGSLRRLLEDIRYEVTDSNQANRLLQEGRDTYEYLQRFITLTRANSDYTRLNQDFGRLQTEWSRYEKLLRRVNNRYVDRQVQRIDDSVRRLQGLLYIESGQTNRDDVIYSTKLLVRDTDQFLKRINLKMLISLPVARRGAVEAASDFAVGCNDLMELLNEGEDFEVIRDVYLVLHDEWERLSHALQGVSSQQARQSMRDIERSLSELQGQLGIQFDLDRTQATRLADSLHSNARHLQGDIREFFGRPNRYPREFQTTTLKAAADFQANARNLRQRLQNGDKLRQLTAACEQMCASWSALDREIPRFSSSEQAQLYNIRRQLVPQIVQMQTLLVP